MEVQGKLETLVAAAQFDVCGYDGMRHTKSPPMHFIHRAALPGGGSVCLFKILLTNVCTNDCAYCANQVGRDGPRTSFPRLISYTSLNTLTGVTSNKLTYLQGEPCKVISARYWSKATT